MQIKRQNLQKKSYQTVLFCNFQQLKPSYFAYFAAINCTKKKHPRYLPRVLDDYSFLYLASAICSILWLVFQRLRTMQIALFLTD